jgi:hypothetical protein
MADAKARFRIEGEDATAAAFRSALGSAKTTADKMSGLFKTAFVGISAASLANVAARSIEMGDELGKAAVKAGVTGKAMSELAFAGKMADIELGAISTSLRFMQKNLSEAASGAKAPRENLAALGLTFEQLFALEPDRQFELIADRISLLTNPADRARAATELFGKAGADLLPLFEDGAEGIRKAREEAQKFGLAFNDEQLAQFAKADDALKKLKAGFDGVAGAATLAVSKGLEGFGKGLKDLSSGNFALDSALNAVRVQAAVDARRAEIEAGGKAGGNPFAGARNIFAPGVSGPGGFKDPSAGGNQTGTDAAAKAAKSEGISEADRRRYARMDQDLELRREFSKSVEDSFTDFSKKADEFAERYVESFKKPFAELDVYSQRAAENMQDAFANFLFDPFKDGLKGMLRGFIDVIRQMVAQQAAAQIFGSKASGGSGFGDFITGAVSSFFGGFRANGGPVSAGKGYVVGERGPELFLPRSSGSIVPNGGGGMTIAPVYNIDARGATQDVIRMLPAILEANTQRTLELARAQTRDDISRRAMR